MAGDQLLRRAVMAPNDAAHPVTLAKPQGTAMQSGVGRAFGFLVHDVSRLIKRRFERRARQMGCRSRGSKRQSCSTLQETKASAKPRSRLGSI
jgi:hypothetical protein